MIKVAFPPATLSGHANGNGRWKKINVTKAFRQKAFDATHDAYPPEFIQALPDEGDIRLHISFFPPDRRGDRCNYPNRLKPILDGIADALGVNDKRFLPSYHFCPIDRANARVEVRIGT